MPAIANAREGMSILKTQLQLAVNGAYSAGYARYAGARVLLESEEPNDSERVGSPRIILAVDSDTESRFSAPGRPRYDARIGVEVRANDSSGARIGRDNPTPSDEQLSDDLMDWIRNNRAALELLGLLRTTIAKGRETVRPVNDVQTHINPHTISFTYLRS